MCTAAADQLLEFWMHATLSPIAPSVTLPKSINTKPQYSHWLLGKGSAAGNEIVKLPGVLFILFLLIFPRSH